MYMENFCIKVERILDTITSKISVGSLIDAELNSLDKLWNDSKQVIFVFTNHNLYSDVDEIIVKLRSFSTQDEFDDVVLLIHLLENEKNKLRDALRFDIGNIF